LISIDITPSPSANISIDSGKTSFNGTGISPRPSIEIVKSSHSVFISQIPRAKSYAYTQVPSSEEAKDSC